MTTANFENSESFTENPSEDEDPVEAMIKKTGCEDVHFKVQVLHLGDVEVERAVGPFDVSAWDVLRNGLPPGRFAPARL